MLPYRPEQLYELVAGVERYPEFLPWCMAARITRREGDTFYADLVVALQDVPRALQLEGDAAPARPIDVEYIDGPFRYLNNHWRFIEAARRRLHRRLLRRLRVQSRMLQKLIGMLFNEAVQRMVGAFETRARQLYGGRPRAARRCPARAGRRVEGLTEG